MATLALLSCGDDDGSNTPVDAGPDRTTPIVDGSFFCFNQDDQACLRDTYFSCQRAGEFLEPVSVDCALTGQVCVQDIWCTTCRPQSIRCGGEDNNTAQVCSDDSTTWEDVEVCDREAGEACIDGNCVNLCQRAVARQSYQGCEFFAADLDNASIAIGRDASAQQYAVVVSNVGPIASEVVVEVNDAPFGSPVAAREVERVNLLPGDIEVLRLARREVDGSSSNQQCFPDNRNCPLSEVCLCSQMDTASPCFCRISPDASGMNDGTHTAVTSQAYRITSQLPIIAYQFNPLDNVGVFSNDASLLLPTSAINDRYTVIGWPQTIAHNPDDPTDVDTDFSAASNPARDDEDLRAALTIVGTRQGTNVSIQLGPRVSGLVGAGPIPEGLGPDDMIDLVIGPYDVINLETFRLNSDFTGTFIQASEPISVFTGGEASDAPRFDTYSTRQCCADHLEEQLFPDQTLGTRFVIGRMPRRSVALNQAFLNPMVDSVPEPNEPEWVRVLATAAGTTTVTTTLPPPDDRFSFSQRQSIILRADQDFIMSADKPIAVLQVLSSQEAVGIDNRYPGGDPAIIAVPPTEQWRQDYVFLTPDLYAFDFVTIAADATANILLDGEPLDPRVCTTSPADGIPRLPGDPPPQEVIYRCQLSFPDVIGLPNVRVEDGLQDDGVHIVVADQPVGLVVYGFDAFVSYAYAAGLNLDIIN
ncbi:MAG: IgGFc-binding protein [Myxococcota bacterium]